MTRTVMIAASPDAVVPLEELYEILAHDHIQTTQTPDGHITSIIVTWPDDGLRLTLNVLPAAERAAYLADLRENASDWLGTRTDKKAQKITRRLEGVSMVYRCTVEPDWDSARRAQHLVQGVMAAYDYALLASADAIYNENGNREIGADDSDASYFPRDEVEIVPESGAPLARKKRSIAQLKKEKIPTIDHLPALPDASQITLRPADAVAKRAMTLYFIAQLADTGDRDAFQAHIKAYGLSDTLTPDEREFAEDDDPPEYITLKFSERLEAAWTLLWAIGLLDYLDRPDTFASNKKAASLIEAQSADQIIAAAQLRPVDDILDTLDLTYRYHWAVLDAELYGRRAPGKLEGDVVYERHYALNWLIHYKDQSWDEITTDT